MLPQDLTPDNGQREPFPVKKQYYMRRNQSVK